MSFPLYDKQLYQKFMISIENFYLVEKQNKENFAKKNRRLRNREKHMMSLTFEDFALVPQRNHDLKLLAFAGLQL